MQYDVIIIGGSYAGLSAALSLGRSLRKVLVLDSGLPCNRQTPHSHNFLTQDGATPAYITRQAKEQLIHYPSVQLLDDLAVSAESTPDGFNIFTHKGEHYRAKKLICATGIRDLMPGIPGFSKCWGTTLIHCPYCHGYEFHEKNTGIMANGERAMHLAGLVRNLTPHLTILTNGPADFTQEQRSLLQRHQIGIKEELIERFEHKDGILTQVFFEGNGSTPFDAIYASLPFEQHSSIPEQLGCAFTEHGHIKVDSTQQTNIPGLYACGDNTNAMRSVANAVASGNLTGAMVNKQLVDEVFR